VDSESSLLSSLEYYPLISARSRYFPNDDFSVYRIGINLNLVTELNGLKRVLYDFTASKYGQIRTLEASYLFAFFLRDNCWINRFLPVPNAPSPSAPRYFTICALELRSDMHLRITTPAGTTELEINQPVVMRAADVLSGEWKEKDDYSKHTIVAGLWT